MRKLKKHPLSVITLKYRNHFTYSELCRFLKISRKTLNYWVADRWEKRWEVKDFPRPKRILVNKYVPGFLVSEVFNYLGLELPKTQGGDIYFITSLLKISEAAELIGKTPRTLKRWIYEEKSLSVIRIGNKGLVRIRIKDLERVSREKGFYAILKLSLENTNISSREYT